MTRGSALALAARGILWTLLLPGLVAGYLPWRFFGIREAQVNLSDPLQLLGLLAFFLGLGLLLACIWHFARRGLGTLSPVDPPRRLVVVGPYRYVRNPMYLAVSLMLLGESAFLGSGALVVYWAIWFAAASLFVVGYEEPSLRRRFGSSYEEYAASVGRWFPRFHRPQA